MFPRSTNPYWIGLRWRALSGWHFSVSGLCCGGYLTSSSLVVIGTNLAFIGVIIAWGLGTRQPFESFRDPAPVVAAFLLVLLGLRWMRNPLRHTLLISLLICFTMIAASLYYYNYYTVRIDEDWHAVQLWARDHSQKDEQFLITEGAGNFRTRSFRSSVAEADSALAWVAPLTYRENADRVGQVAAGLKDGKWDLNYLACLAKQWQTAYVVVKGAYGQTGLGIVFQTGSYAIFHIDLAHTTGTQCVMDPL